MDGPMLRFGRDECVELERSLRREWIETNGLGGFASSTISGIHTRRYHGLLTVATKPPVGRIVLLAKLEETLVLGDRRFDLSANRYPGVIHPEGFRYLKEFRLDPFPIYTYEVDGIEVEKRVFMVHGENTTVIEYEVRGQPGILEIRPLIAFRDYHSTSHSNGDLNAFVNQSGGLATVAPYAGVPAPHFAHNAASLRATGEWYYNFEYDIERERGLDYREDLFNPFVASFNLDGRARAAIIASTQRRNAAEADALRQSEIERRAAINERSPSREPLALQLTQAADQFIVNRGEFKTIIAGYHWFADWGRDTMIALPGLTLVTGCDGVARNILEAFAHNVSQGMLPNRFPDAGEAPEYNTVDATLWFFEAVRQYLNYAGGAKFVRDELFEVLKDMIEWHLRGTRYGIHVDSDGLLFSGEPGVQLTWMDVKIGDWVVTPRTGKAVEIQALWYNALRIMERLARTFDDLPNAGRYAEMAALAKASFNRLFWNESGGCLYDVVNGDLRDGSIRPNQIFAASLHHTMLSQEKARQVVAVVQRELLTPYGLRTLSRADPQYRPRYEGDGPSRDSAYHQGTVWPWLMGPFITAYVEVNGRTGQARRQALEWLAPLQEHLRDAGLGQVSEIFDAEPPHQPRGCMAQAWSVAEILRALSSLE